MHFSQYQPNNVPIQLRWATDAVNKAVLKMYGDSGCCILASFALFNMIHSKERGCNAVPIRVEAHIFPEDRKHYAATLGWDGDGTRRPKSEKDMWHGHLCVLVNDLWLLDPTIDQVNREGIQLPPLTFEMKSLNPRESTAFSLNKCDVRYSVYHNQKGFRDAPDARKSHWTPVAEQALEELDGIMAAPKN